MNAIMPRATIEDIVRYRDQAMALYEAAYAKISDAAEAIKAAHAMARNCHPGTNSYNYSEAREIEAFRNAVCLPERAQYLCTARRLTDLDAWSWIVERTDLQRLMDTQAKEQLSSQMRYIPDRVDRDGQLINEGEIAKGMPPLTVDNIMATLEQFALDADTIFRRGIANAFSKLDRRFRSHDGFKIGSRLILTRVFDDSGRLSYGNIRHTLIDIERVFAVLDGQTEADFTSALYAIDLDRRGVWQRQQSEVETEYFKIRSFMNGNAHLWFQRADLVAKVNKLLAEYYGEVIGDGSQTEEDPFANIKNLPAKRFGFYPTPDGACDRVFRNISTLQRADAPQLRILEPSAGTGNLARRCVHSIEELDNWSGGRSHYLEKYRFDNLVDCVEIQPALAENLQAEGIYNRVYAKDFLQLTPDVTGLYDIVIMNPPFDRERDIDHAFHALKFLKDDGWLVAIMSAGTEFRETKKSAAFRALMQKMNAQWEDLPAGSFSSTGTNVNTLFVKVWKNGTRFGR